MILNHLKNHLFELHFIIYIDQNIIRYSHIMFIVMHIKTWLCTSKNLTAVSHKITNDIHMNYHINQKYDSQKSYFKYELRELNYHIIQKYELRELFSTLVENMTHKSHIPHQQKIWLYKVIFHVSQNMIHYSHIPLQPKIWLQRVICHVGFFSFTRIAQEKVKPSRIVNVYTTLEKYG